MKCGPDSPDPLTYPKLVAQLQEEMEKLQASVHAERAWMPWEAPRLEGHA
jgi:capsule polysaccharide export protein KpsE/RkpR